MNVRAFAFVALLAFAAFVDRSAMAADHRSAAREFAAGERAYNAGDYRRAAEAFESAYRASPHHAPLWNAARSWLRSGQDVRAANLLERYLREAPIDAPDRDHATTALTEVAKRIARIELHRALARDVEVDDSATAAAVIYVAPGEHVVRATASDGSAFVRRITVAAGAVASISLAPVVRAEPVEAASSQTSTTPLDVVTEKEKPRSSKPLSPWFVAAGAAATAASGGLTVMFGVQTIDARDAFHANQRSEELYRNAVDSQARTNVALATTGVLALATGAMALFTDWGGGR